MEKFVNAMKVAQNETLTENGAYALKSTTNFVLDLFGVIGSLRTRSKDEIIDLFCKSYSEDKLLSLKMAFYARDIRGGLGERDTFRTIIKYLANKDPETLKVNINLIPEYGRWDDLYSLVGTKLEDDAFNLIKETLNKDIKIARESKRTGNYKPISLCAKWLKSVQATSKESKALARLTAKKTGLYNEKYHPDFYLEYQPYISVLSELRAYLKVVERLLSTNNIDKIEYSTVPALAMKRYNKTFMNKDTMRFESFLNSVAKGESKINSNTLYPYDIIRTALKNQNNGNNVLLNDTLKSQWKSLPNYIENEADILVMCDLSGSMYWHNNMQAISTSVGLGLYFAERNKGAFHNTCMTFSKTPNFITFKDEMNIEDKIRHMLVDSNVGYNTDIAKAMELILKVAIDNNLSQNELPKSLVIISDMEFDIATVNNNKNFYETMKSLYLSHGYELPNIVFWNVESRKNTFHAKNNDKGVQLASGSSPSVFKAICENVGLSAEELMFKVLNSERYSLIKLGE